MQGKLGKITHLKQKILTMQNQLQVLEKQNQNRKEFAPRILKMTSSPRKNSKNRQYRSPTFWGSNPLMGGDEIAKLSSSISPSKLRDVERIQKSLSPKLRVISQKNNQHYYQSNPLTESNSQPQQINKEIFYQTAFLGKRFQHAEFGCRRDTPRFQKKKTFVQPKTDLILNPQRQKSIGRKIVKKIQKSPDRMLTENPKSNTNLYWFSQKAIVLEKKGGVNTQKNKSALDSILSSATSSLSNLTWSPKETLPKSNKKHYTRYFEENFFSHLD